MRAPAALATRLLCGLLLLVHAHGVADGGQTQASFSLTGTYSRPPSPPPPALLRLPPVGSSSSGIALDNLLRLLHSTANNLGLNFLVKFFEAFYPPTADVVKDSPVATYYIYKLLRDGLDPRLSDPDGQAAYSLYRILHSAFASLVGSPSGSIVADVALRNHHIDMSVLARAQSMKEVVSIFKLASWWSTDGHGAIDIVQSVTDAVNELVVNAVAPYGRLTPIELAFDIVDFFLSVVSSTLENADALRNNADAALYMSDDEYFAFLRLEENFKRMSLALSKLSADRPSPPPPPSPPLPPSPPPIPPRPSPPPPLQDGQVRLVNGNSPNEGRVEIFHNGVWGTVCDDNFDTYAAKAVCRQLGYPAGGVPFSRAYFGAGTGPIFLDGFYCTSTSMQLTECYYISWGQHDCSHQEDAGVRCTGA